MFIKQFSFDSTKISFTKPYIEHETQISSPATERDSAFPFLTNENPS